jgi:tRNA/tmRNA/rRNA uracil-C5-methylase (TrmA/RlmC/RlmD family)
MKNESEIQLLDPPRQGTDPGVILALAKRCPKRVVHVFCGTDVIPKELTVWNSKGYKIKKIQPLDLFPGTSHIETMVLLEK